MLLFALVHVAQSASIKGNTGEIRMSKNRKQNYVDTKVQGSLLRRIVMHWCIFFVVAFIAVIAMQALLGDPAQSMSERISEKSADMAVLGVVLLAIFPAFLLDTVRFSNRFAGPIVRLRRGLRELADNGTTNDLAFRDEDFWIEMANEFNRVKEMVESKKSTSKTSAETPEEVNA